MEKFKGKLKELIEKMPDNKVIFSGIWSWPIGIIFIGIIMGVPISRMTIIGFFLCLLGGLFLPAILLVKNFADYKRGKRRFTFKNMFKSDIQSSAKRDALYPEVPSKYLSSTPEGYILAKYKGKYMRLSSEKALNTLIIGPPGSGKTVTLLSSILADFAEGKDPEFQVIVMDAKGEIHQKGLKNGNPAVKIVDPTRMASTGWDPYFAIDKNDLTQDEMEDSLDLICRALIKEGSEENAYFTNNARDLFKGMLAYYFEYQSLDFADSILKLIQTPTPKILEEIEKNAEDGSTSKKYLSKFMGKGSSESINDVDTTMREELSLFGKDALVWAFGKNPDKVSPEALDEGKSIFFSLPQSAIKTYSAYLRLVLSQTIHYLMTRPEGSKPILFILDELPTYGKLNELCDALSTLRSRGVSIWCIVQSLSQLRSAYGEDDAKTIQNDCQVKLVLNCDDMDTAKPMAEMFGMYIETKISQNFSADIGQKQTGSSASNEQKQAVDPTDLTNLKNLGEIAMSIDGEYFRTKKLEYWKDKVLGPISADVNAYNKANPEQTGSAATNKVTRRQAGDKKKEEPVEPERTRRKTQDNIPSWQDNIPSWQDNIPSWQREQQSREHRPSSSKPVQRPERRDPEHPRPDRRDPEHGSIDQELFRQYREKKENLQNKAADNQTERGSSPVTSRPVSLVPDDTKRPSPDLKKNIESRIIKQQNAEIDPVKQLQERELEQMRKEAAERMSRREQYKRQQYLNANKHSD